MSGSLPSSYDITPGSVRRAASITSRAIDTSGEARLRPMMRGERDRLWNAARLRRNSSSRSLVIPAGRGRRCVGFHQVSSWLPPPNLSTGAPPPLADRSFKSRSSDGLRPGDPSSPVQRAAPRYSGEKPRK
jgi:hypothetical protein